MGPSYEEYTLMAGPLPHGKQFAQWTIDYLADSERITRKSFSALSNSPEFRRIYRNSFAGDAVISKLSSTHWRPRSHSMRCLILRIPFIVGVRQISLAAVELRRLIEITFWVIYFTDHPVEWAEFEANPSKGFHPSIEQPIRYCARRGLKLYVDYAAERFQSEPSGLAKIAVEDLRKLSAEINPIVHPAQLSTATRKPPPFENLGAADLSTFEQLQKAVFSASALALASLFRREFDKFPATYRAQFDWLIGDTLAKKIRAGNFGLP
jgi:hypothetical protein